MYAEIWNLNLMKGYGVIGSIKKKGKKIELIKKK